MGVGEGLRWSQPPRLIARASELSYVFLVDNVIDLLVAKNIVKFFYRKDFGVLLADGQ